MIAANVAKVPELQKLTRASRSRKGPRCRGPKESFLVRRFSDFDLPAVHRRPVVRPVRASGSAADVAGRPSGRHLVVDRLGRLVDFADWTSITPWV
jgi:hypothetical protein